MPDATGSPAEDLRRLADARAALDAASAEVREAVAASRRAGRSWADVGAALGVTRQAAFKRFGTARDPRTGDAMTPTAVDEVVALTERAFTLLAAGDTATLTGMLSAPAAATLTRDLLGATWARAVAETGALVEVRGTTVHLPEPDGSEVAPGEAVLGALVGRTELVCEAGSWHGRAAVDLDGRVSGLLVVPPGSTGLPF